MTALFLERQLALIDVPAQRWWEREESWTPGAEPIRTSDYEVAAIPDDTTARAFVVRHHYSATYPAARRRFGLYHRSGELVGVAVLGQSVSERAMTAWFPDALSSLELQRLVLLDGVKGNGESFFVGEVFRRLRAEGFVGVLSFSDPEPRTRQDGSRVHRGHCGIVYQALSAHVRGRSTARTLRLLPDGRAVNERSLQKIRAGERGGSSEAQLVADLVVAGARPFDAADPRAWVRSEVPRVTRAMKHPGNFRYLWGFTRALRRAYPANPGDYPRPIGGRAPPRWGRRAAA